MNRVVNMTLYNIFHVLLTSSSKWAYHFTKRIKFLSNAPNTGYLNKTIKLHQQSTTCISLAAVKVSQNQMYKSSRNDKGDVRTKNSGVEFNPEHVDFGQHSLMWRGIVWQGSLWSYLAEMKFKASYVPLSHLYLLLGGRQSHIHSSLFSDKVQAQHNKKVWRVEALNVETVLTMIWLHCYETSLHWIIR